jgi:phage shock protein A
MKPTKRNGISVAASARSAKRKKKSEDGSVEDANLDRDEHNYSITNRWRMRDEKWKQWMTKMEKQASSEDFDLGSLELLTADDLFLTIDESDKSSSPLGEAFKGLESNVQKLKNELVEYRRESEDLEKEIRDLQNELEDLEKETRDLKTKGPAAQEATLLPDSLNSQIQQLIADNIKTKTELIKTKTELIKTNMEQIKSNTELIKSNTELVKSKTKLVKGNTELFGMVITATSRAHIEMRNKLTYFTSRGNESLLTATSKIQTLDGNRFYPKKAPSLSELDAYSLVKKDSPFTSELIDLVSTEEKATLLLLQKFVVDIFEKATKTDDAVMVKATTNAILKWTSETIVDEKTKYARPPTDRDSEATADQPILQAVICRIIETLANSNASAVQHEQEDGATTEQSVVVSNVGNMKDRRIDTTVSPREEYLAPMLPMMVKKAIEIKTAREEEGKFNKALEKGRSQIVGHLGKRLLYAFDFGGAGKNDSALGVSLTHLSIEVIKMTLAGVGTDTVLLDMSKTGCVPLLGKESLTDAQTKGFDSMGTNGILLLAGALKYRTPQEFDLKDISSLQQVEPTKKDLGPIEYLGSGAFSNVVGFGSTAAEVFSATGEFMKLPKSAAQAKSLEQEAAILRKLESGNDEVIPSIPRLVIGGSNSGISTLRTVIRGEISSMIGLRLRGVVGVPLDRVQLLSWQKHSKAIIEQVYDALQFAHGKKIYHLDVRPGNIIVDASSDSCHAMLSDWGCSVDGNAQTRLKNFCGCTPYAHDRLLGNKFKGMLDPYLDFASLTYTIHHVCARQLKWSFPFDRPSNVSPADLEDRREKVNDWLSKEEERDEQQRLAPGILEKLWTACRPRRSERNKNPR